MALVHPAIKLKYSQLLRAPRRLLLQMGLWRCRNNIAEIESRPARRANMAY